MVQDSHLRNDKQIDMHQSIAGYHTNNRNNSLHSPAPRNSAVITIATASGRPDRTQQIERDN